MSEWDRISTPVAPPAPASWDSISSPVAPKQSGNEWDRISTPVASAPRKAAPAYDPKMNEEPAQGSWLGNQIRGRGHLYGGDFGKSVNKGHAEEMLSYVGAVKPQVAHEQRQNIEQAYPTKPGALDTIGRATGAMISQLPQMIMGGPAVMAPLGGIAGYGRAREQGSGVAASLAHGAVGAALGAAQIPVARGIASKVLPRVGDGIAARLAVNTGANYAEQLAAGAAGTVAGNLIDKASIDPNRPVTQGLTDVPLSSILGALAGGVAMTAHGAAKPQPEAAPQPRGELTGQYPEGPPRLPPTPAPSAWDAISSPVPTAAAEPPIQSPPPQNVGSETVTAPPAPDLRPPPEPKEPGVVPHPVYNADELNRMQNPALRRQAELYGVDYDTRGTSLPRILDAQERWRLGQMTPKELWDEVRSRGLRAGSRDANIETLLSAGREKPVQPQAQPPQPIESQQQPTQQGLPEDTSVGGAQEKSPEPVSTGASTQVGRSSPGVPGRAAFEAPEAPFTVTPAEGPVKPKVEAAPAPRPAKTPFTRQAIERKLLDFHEQMGGGYTAHDETIMEGNRSGSIEAAQSTADPHTFLGSFPGEVKRYLEQNPAARRKARQLFTLTDDPTKAGGADALGAMGEDKYFAMADKLIGSQVNEAKKTARGSQDPAMQFWTSVHDNLPPARERPAQVGVKASELNTGQEFELNGSKFQVVEDENGLRVLKDGDEYPETPVEALGDQKIPVDKGTLHQGEEPEVPDDVFGGLEPAATPAPEGPKLSTGTLAAGGGKDLFGNAAFEAKPGETERFGFGQDDQAARREQAKTYAPEIVRKEVEVPTGRTESDAKIASQYDEAATPGMFEKPPEQPGTTAQQPAQTPPAQRTPPEAGAGEKPAGERVYFETVDKKGNKQRVEGTLTDEPLAFQVDDVTQARLDAGAMQKVKLDDGRIMPVASAKPVNPKPETSPQPWKEKAVSRRVNNSQRDLTIRTFTGKTSAEYDAFLSARPEGAEMRRGTKAPTVDIDGRPQYASYEFRAEPPPEKPPEILGHGSSPRRPSPEKVKTDLARALVGAPPTPAAAPDAAAKPAEKAPAKSEPAVLAAAWDGMRKIFAPQTRTPEAGRAAGYAREHGAELAQRIDRAEASLREARAMFQGRPRDENLAFIDKMERGEKQGEGAQEAFAAQIRKLLDERRTEVQKLGKGKLQHFIQDYFPHIWADPEKARQVFAQIAGKRPLEGGKSFLKQRTIPTVAEGIKLGLEPVSDNPVDLVLLKLREMDRYIMGQRLLRDMKNAGLVKYVRATEQMPDGYAKIDDNIATVYGPPTVKVPEYVNKGMWDTLNSVAAGLGVTHERKMTLGKSRALGLSYQGADKIETRFGTDLSVMAHEISHQLDHKHDLQSQFLEGRTKKFQDELRTLADLHGYKEKYFRKKAEKMATLLEAYVRMGPEEMRHVAPMVTHEFTQYMKQVPALKPLLEYRPTLSEKKLTGEKPHGGLLIMGQYHAPEAVAQVLNNYLSPGLRGHASFGPAFRAYQGTANTLNQAQLGLSFFHLGFTSMDASISKFAVALERGADAVRLAAKAETRAQAPRQLAIAAREALGTVAAPVTNAMQGDKLLKEWMNPGSTGDPEIARLTDAMKAAGGRVRLDPFYKTDHYHKMMEAFGKGNVVAAALHAVPAGFEKLSAPVMEYIVPRQKLGVFADMARLELEKLTRDNPSPSREQVRAAMGKAWDSVDNRMGQLVYDNLFWKKAAKDLAMASVRSVGWNLGSLREIPGGAIDYAKAAGNIARGRSPEFTRRMAYVSSMTVLAGLSGGAMTYLMTGKPPEELKDYYFPRTGRTDAQGRPIRLSLPTYVKDVVHMTNAPLTTAKNKLHPLIGMVADMLANEDFYGTEIRNPDDPLVKQALSLASYVGKTVQPFSVRGYQNLSEEGVPFAEKAGSFIGVTRAPRDLSLSKAELLAEELSRAEMPQGSRTSEQAEKSKLKHDLELQLRGKDPKEFNRLAREALKQGKLTNKDLSDIVANSRLPGLVRRLRTMDAGNAAKVYEAATDEERKTIRGPVTQKVMNSETFTNEQKRALLLKVGILKPAAPQGSRQVAAAAH